MSSKYDAGQEIHPGPPESSDVRKKEIHKFVMCKHIVGLSGDRGRRIFQRQSPSGAQGKKA